jgi:WASH complex subunit strumpellin
MEEFRESHLEILRRFYKMFESIYQYCRDLCSFCDQIKEGIYVSHTVEVYIILFLFYFLIDCFERC